MAAPCQWGCKNTELCHYNDTMAATHVFPLAIEPGVSKQRVFIGIFWVNKSVASTDHIQQYPVGSSPFLVSFVRTTFWALHPSCPLCIFNIYSLHPMVSDQ